LADRKVGALNKQQSSDSVRLLLSLSITTLKTVGDLCAGVFLAAVRREHGRGELGPASASVSSRGVTRSSTSGRSWGGEQVMSARNDHLDYVGGGEEVTKKHTATVMKWEGLGGSGGE
jgi:hypothetical protein